MPDLQSIEPGFEAFVGRLCSLAGRGVGLAAAQGGRRRSIGWATDAFLLGLLDGLEEAEVPARVAADMLGISRRTLQRQRSAARERAQGRNRSIWSRIYDVVRSEHPTAAELEARIVGVEPAVVASVLRDMIHAGWIEERGDLLAARAPEDLSVDQIRELLFTLRRNGFVVPTPAELVSDYGLHSDRARQVLEQPLPFDWDGDEPANRWYALEHVMKHIEQFLVARLQDESSTRGGVWVLRVSGRDPSVETRLRQEFTVVRERLGNLARELASPGILWGDEERSWAVTLLETNR